MISRRTFLKRAGKGTAALTCAPSAMITASGIPRNNTPLILHLHCDGGWDPSMVFDPKLNSSHVSSESGLTSKQENALTFGSHVNRPSVDSYFTNFGDNSIVFNGVYTNAIDHKKAAEHNFGKRFKNHANDYIDYLTYLANQWQPNSPVPHASFNIKTAGGPYSGSSMYFDNDILTLLSNRDESAGQMSSDSEAALNSFLDLSFTDTVLTRPKVGRDAEKVYALYRGYKRDRSLRDQINDFYNAATAPGQPDHLTHAKMGLSMMANSFSQCCSVRVGDFRQWDTHQNHFATQSVLFETLFSTLNTLINESSSLGISDRLILLVTSDLGRAPNLNSNAGKDHWPYTSALIWSPTLNGGQTIGATDDWLRGYTIDPETSTTSDQVEEANETIPASRLTNLTMEQILCSIFYAVGQVHEFSFPEHTPIKSIIS